MRAPKPTVQISAAVAWLMATGFPRAIAPLRLREIGKAQTVIGKKVSHRMYGLGMTRPVAMKFIVATQLDHILREMLEAAGAPIPNDPGMMLEFAFESPERLNGFVGCLCERVEDHILGPSWEKMGWVKDAEAIEAVILHDLVPQLRGYVELEKKIRQTPALTRMETKFLRAHRRHASLNGTGDQLGIDLTKTLELYESARIKLQEAATTVA